MTRQQQEFWSAYFSGQMWHTDVYKETSKTDLPKN